jgi:hypothetical protein
VHRPLLLLLLAAASALLLVARGLGCERISFAETHELTAGDLRSIEDAPSPEQVSCEQAC